MHCLQKWKSTVKKNQRAVQSKASLTRTGKPSGSDQRGCDCQRSTESSACTVPMVRAHRLGDVESRDVERVKVWGSSLLVRAEPQALALVTQC